MDRRAFIGLVAASLPPVALAHHGWSGYEADHGFTLTGTIVDVSYEYPHATIHVKGPDRTWLCVLAPPYRMDTRGVARDALKPGMTVTIEGFPHRNDRAEMRAERITFGGKTVELR